MPRFIYRLCVVLAAAVFPWVAHATAQVKLPSAENNALPISKFALVIGNSNYASDKRSLKNPVNDARLMTQTLQKLGFDVSEHRDLDRAGMVRAVGEFSRKLPVGATAWVFYAGHGMQIGGASYLIPVDMKITSEQSIPVRAYPVKTLLESLAASRSSVNVVVLDACRDNPFQPMPAVRYRNFSNLGLAPVQAPRGTLVAYSTAPGQLAADGQGSHSIYTSELSRALLEPGVSLEQMFKKAGNLVRKKTLDDQIPWFESSLAGEYFLQPPPGVSVVAGLPLKGSGSAEGDASVSRSARVTVQQKADDPVWFRTMSEREWSELDWEIQQRVKHLTVDELPMFEHRAKAGNVVAMTTLGLAWRDGMEKAVDPASGKVIRFQSNNTKALRWLRMAAEAGFPIAQTELGEMLYFGRGVDRNVRQSRHWLELAAEANYPRARLNLLQLKIETGEATGQDAQSAIDAMMRAVRPLNRQ